jgi:hypothetical protein
MKELGLYTASAALAMAAMWALVVGAIYLAANLSVLISSWL